MLILRTIEQKSVRQTTTKKKVLHLAIHVPRRPPARRHLPHDDAKNGHSICAVQGVTAADTFQPTTTLTYIILKEKPWKRPGQAHIMVSDDS